ncbi:hypothetical protein DNTS_006245 [Danionella cerebrum]|uniref:Uncharacterized protein n=1 Tax=Danionella cerebrum TaxID=2873325 RepID=A0A553R7S2_9TELE|nr:hypothetical protein DNTS_006245 [Danionella translucida]
MEFAMDLVLRASVYKMEHRLRQGCLNESLSTAAVPNGLNGQSAVVLIVRKWVVHRGVKANHPPTKSPMCRNGVNLPLESTPVPYSCHCEAT